MLVTTATSMFYPLTNSFGQLKGSVRDSLSSEIPYAICTLTTPRVKDWNQIAYTDSAGNFQFKRVPKGTYDLLVYSFGYRSKSIRGIVIPSAYDSLVLGTIYLTPDPVMLDEITIKGDVPFIQQEKNKLVVHVENSVVAKGGAILDVLERVPGVSIDRQSNKIAVRGKEGVQVLLNNKQTYLPDAELLKMLRSQSADDIQKIEIIHTPGAQMDASGDGGVINIVFKRDMADGESLGYTISTGYGRNEKFGANFNYSNRTRKSLLYLTYSGVYNHTEEVWSVHRTSSLNNLGFGLSTDSYRDPVDMNSTLTLGMEYRVDRKTLLSFQTQGIVNHWTMNSENITGNPLSHSDNQFFIQHDTEMNQWVSSINSLSAKYNLDSSSYLGADMDLLFYKNFNKHTYFNDNLTSQEDEVPPEYDLIEDQNFVIRKNTPIDILAFKLDYHKAFSSRWQLDVGVKSVYSDFTNEVVDIDLDEEGETSIVDLNSKNKLNETIHAGFVSLAYHHENLSMSMGLRNEYSRLDFTDAFHHSIFTRRFNFWFPTISADYTFKDKSTLSVTYQERVNRPSFVDLAPFVVFLDPFTYVMGNSSLLPARLSVYSLYYKINSLSLSADYSHSRNAIYTFQPVFEINSPYLLFTPLNISRMRSFNFLLNQEFALANFWRFNLTCHYLFQEVSTPYYNEEIVHRSRHNFKAGISSIVDLKKGVKLEISGYYQNAYLAGIVKREVPGEVSLGIQKNWNEKLSVTLNVTDVFRTKIWYQSASLNANSFVLNRRSDFETRVVRLVFSFRTGKKFDAVIKTPEERKRVN